MNIIQRIISKFKKLDKDKKDHFYLGLIVGFPAVLAFGIWGGVVSLLFVFSIEVYQLVTGKGKFEIWDFVASAIPIILFMSIELIR
jgi:uncharacterized membrane protein (DUF2068 family)